MRATAIQVPFGNFRTELLSAGHAIIHDKIIAIFPCDAENCAVITDSHNLGYKASYCNDDNLVIIRANQALAIAYAVHVLDLYDHYVFRARREQNHRDKLASGTTPSLADGQDSADPSGQLKLDSSWRKGHFAPNRPRSAWDYFLQHTPQPVASRPDTRTLRHRRRVPAEAPRENPSPPVQPSRLPRARPTLYPTGDLVAQSRRDRNEQMPHPH